MIALTHPNPPSPKLSSDSPLQNELRIAGAEELRSAADVDALFRRGGLTLVCVNSVCGLAASVVRPALDLLRVQNRMPEHVVTMLEGRDLDARKRLGRYVRRRSSSPPEIVLVEDGLVVRVWARWNFKHRQVGDLAEEIGEVLDRLRSARRRRRENRQREILRPRPGRGQRARAWLSAVAPRWRPSA